MNSEIIDILEKHNIKPTPMRMLVLESLMVNNENQSLTQLTETLYPADRITIYRTLKTFIKQGLVHSIETLKNGTVFALCSENCSPQKHAHTHPHFICKECHQVTCLENQTYHLTSNTSKENYSIDEIEVNIKGLCPTCLKAK